jgi:hypothetical protein
MSARTNHRPRATSRRDRASNAPNVDGQQPIGQPGDCNMMIDECLIPFHQYAEDQGTYVLAERAREADHARPEDPPEEPSENTD